MKVFDVRHATMLLPATWVDTHPAGSLPTTRGGSKFSASSVVEIGEPVACVTASVVEPWSVTTCSVNSIRVPGSKLAPISMTNGVEFAAVAPGGMSGYAELASRIVTPIVDDDNVALMPATGLANNTLVA